MTAPTTVDPALGAIAAALPRPAWSTEELLAAADGHLSDMLHDMLGWLGVQNRHSILANYPEVLFNGADPKLDTEASQLAASAASECLDKAEVPLDSIGLVLGSSTACATASASRVTASGSPPRTGCCVITGTRSAARCRTCSPSRPGASRERAFSSPSA